MSNDDPRRPYKMYAAILAAALTSFATSAADELPVLVIAGISAVVAGIAVYLTPNPRKAPSSE